MGEGAILTRKNLNLEEDETGASPEGTRSGVLTPVPSRIQGIFSEVQEYEDGSADTFHSPFLPQVLSNRLTEKEVN